MKGRVITGGFQEEDIRWIRLSAEIKTGSSTSLRPGCAGGYTGYEFTLKNTMYDVRCTYTVFRFSGRRLPLVAHCRSLHVGT